MSTIEEIRRIKRSVEGDLLRLPGVTGVDVGRKIINGNETTILSIRVYVKEKGPVPKEHVVPPEIQGVPTDVIERRFRLS